MGRLDMLIEMNDKDLVFTESKEYVLTSVVSDHGIYERVNASKLVGTPSELRRIGFLQLGFDWYRLKLILNSRANALEIIKILDKDEIDHKKLQENLI